MKKLTRNLKVELSDDEKLNLMRQMVEITAERSEAEGKLASVSAEYKGTIKSKNAEHDRIAQLVHQGWDYREVEVEEQRDERTKEIVVYRVDTWAEVHRRNMSPEERQLSLKFDGPGDPLSEGAPEDSAKNAKAFLKKKGKDAEPEEFDGKFINDGTDPSNPENEPESVGDVEADGEHDAHPQCGAGGCYLPKLATRHEVELKGLDFTAVVRTIQDSRDGCWHSQWAFGSSVKPVFKGESRANDFEPNCLSYDSEGRAIIGASIAMLDAIKAHDKWTKVASGRALDIIGQIERFQGAQVVTVEEAASAVAAD